MIIRVRRSFLVASHHWRTFLWNPLYWAICSLVLFLWNLQISRRRLLKSDSWVCVALIFLFRFTCIANILNCSTLLLFTNSKVSLSILGGLYIIWLIFLRKFDLILWFGGGVTFSLLLVFRVLKKVSIFVFREYRVVVVPLRVLFALFNELLIEHGISNLVVNFVSVNFVILYDNNRKFLSVLLGHAPWYNNDQVLLNKLFFCEYLLINNKATLKFAKSIA